MSTNLTGKSTWTDSEQIGRVVKLMEDTFAGNPRVN